MDYDVRRLNPDNLEGQGTILELVPCSSELIRQDVKALIDKGFLRWTDPNRGLDEYHDDEPLPIELTPRADHALAVEAAKARGPLPLDLAEGRR